LNQTETNYSSKTIGSDLWKACWNDTNNNGKKDYFKVLIPHLSNQEFKVSCLQQISSSKIGHPGEFIDIILGDVNNNAEVRIYRPDGYVENVSIADTSYYYKQDFENPVSMIDTWTSGDPATFDRTTEKKHSGLALSGRSNNRCQYNRKTR